MMMFNKLLLALDLSPESDNLLNRVARICQDDMRRVHVVHVLRSGMHDLYHSSLDWETNLDMREARDHAIVRVNAVLRRNNFQVDANRIFIRAGEPAHEIKKLAHEIEADLVIVGSHCKKGGWLELPGATTNCVLQGIDSDVMAVRV